MGVAAYISSDQYELFQTTSQLKQISSSHLHSYFRLQITQ